MKNLLGKKILITGGAGFLGSHIADALVEEGAEVSIFDLMNPTGEKNISHLGDRIEVIRGDITDGKQVDDAVRGMDAVVETAFPASGCDRDPANQHVAVGTVGVFNVLKACSYESIPMVFASSISVYGVQRYVPIDEAHHTDPFLLYGATKLAGENYCRLMAQSYHTRVVVLRFSDMYGPRNGRNSAPVNFLQQAVKGESLIIKGDGQQVRSYLYISDAAAAVRSLLHNFPRPGMIYNVGGPEPVTVRELAEIAGRVCGREVRLKFEPGNTDSRRYIIDGSRIAADIGFKPVTGIFAGMQHTLKWLQRSED
ncbi:MAG: SDR family NAD(P)-dependent oxidoreductase [Desulfotomaculaceae bacterium]|nr:SDR family NAD(P)-dependent oxidoreductase [Desulfotomaculaceae bacterium]